MCTITVRLNYQGMLWPEGDRHFSWDGNTAHFTEADVGLSVEIDLSHEDQVALCETIAALPTRNPPADYVRWINFI
jgi:hypothetical protein